ncbi:hypothetical protein CPB83DRAFT_885041 [Crepidotus variabilis]|uniref:Uncharacterized protein n=1 Tax=Crepidotus variabilis TaxID=179855 RepID=A0A9P6JN11_9AGAR|nr:hypothetical protein CPB83DRAFT_885041 [Crepidotus variabilis]
MSARHIVESHTEIQLIKLNFPGQETTAEASNIPTVIYYDSRGKVKAVGAEATQEGKHEIALEEQWIKADSECSICAQNSVTPQISLTSSLHFRWAKRSLTSLLISSGIFFIAPQPIYKIPTTALWNTFMTSTQNPNTASDGGIHFILSHPNGWEGKEKTQMREAAGKAGLIFDTAESQKRISFVTEGEASLHFAMQNDLLSDIKEGEGIAMVDAGGRRKEKQGKQLFEESQSRGPTLMEACSLQLQRRLSSMVYMLADSAYFDDLEHITSCFDKTTKVRFRNDQDLQFIKFGSSRDNDANVGIRFGQIKLPGTDFAQFSSSEINDSRDLASARSRYLGGKPGIE